MPFENLGTVTKNGDGDNTFVDEETNRISNIQTAESVHPDADRNTPEGKLASAFATAMLPEGSKVKTRQYGSDHFGRKTSSVSKIVNGVEMDFGLMSMDQGFSSYYTQYGNHEDPMMDSNYREYFTKHAPYQYGDTAPRMQPEEVADMRRKHENFATIYDAFTKGEAGQEEMDQAAFELYNDPAKVANYRRHLSQWDRQVTEGDHDGSSRFAHDWFNSNPEHRAEYNQAVQNGHLFLKPRPELEPSFHDKIKASFSMFNDIANGIELGELWSAREIADEDMGITEKDVLHIVPPQYHADLLGELAQHGQFAAMTKRDQLLEDIENQKLFDNMEWYAQVGYGIPAFLASPTSLIAGGVIGSAATKGVMAVRAWNSSRLAVGSAVGASWVLGGAAEGVVANFPRLAADHTYTSRDYYLDVAMDSAFGAGLGVVWHGALRPVGQKFSGNFGKEATDARRKEIIELENKIASDKAEEDAPTNILETTPLENIPEGAANRAAKVIADVVNEGVMAVDGQLTDLAFSTMKSKRAHLKAIEGRKEELRGFLESDGSEMTGEFDKDGVTQLQPKEGSVEHRLELLEAQEQRIRKEISDISIQGKNKYVPLEGIDTISSDGFKSVVKTLLKAFPEKSEMWWLLKRHGKLLNRPLDPDTNAPQIEMIEKLNADILKLAANYPSGKIPKGVAGKVRSITGQQQDFKTNNVIGDLLTGQNIKSPTHTLAAYLDRIEDMDIWGDADVSPMSNSDFFKFYGTDNESGQFDMAAEQAGDIDLGLGVDQVPAQVSFIRDVVELNKMAREMDDENFTMLVEKLNGFTAARLALLKDLPDNMGSQTKRYADSTESFGRTVPMSPDEVMAQLRKEGFKMGKGTTPSERKATKRRRQELQKEGKVAVSQDVQDVNLIGPKSTPLDQAVNDKITQPLLPRSFQEVVKTKAYDDPSVENLKVLRDRLRNDILKPLGLLEIKGKSENAGQVARMQRIEKSLERSPRKTVSYMETLGDVQTTVQVIRVSKTIQDQRVLDARIAKEKAAKEASADPAGDKAREEALQVRAEAIETGPLTEELLDPTSPERRAMTPRENELVKARIVEAEKARTKASVAKIGSGMTNFVASGMKRLNELARGPSSKLDFIGKLSNRLVQDLGTKFQNGKLTSLEFIGHHLTEIGKGYGGNARRSASAALIRDFEYRSSAMQILPSYAKTLDAYAASKGKGAVGKMNAQNMAGADNALVAEFNRDMFRLAETMRRGEDTSKFAPELRGFMDEWDKYMDYNHGKLVDAGIEGFTKERKIKHYIPRVSNHGAVRAAVKTHGREKLVTLFEKAYRVDLAEKTSLDSNINTAAKELAEGHVDFIIEQAERARRGEPIPDGYEPAIDSRARARRNIDIRVEHEGLSMLDLLDTELAGVATKYSNRMAGWVGLSKSTDGLITSQLDVDVLKANMVAEGLEKGISTVKYEQYYDDLMNMLMGRPTRGGLEEELRQLKDLTALTRMGGLGTSQLIETGQVVTRAIVNFMSSDEVVKTAFKRAGVDPTDRLLIRDIQNISKITDDIEWLDRQSVHLDQAEIGEANVTRQFSRYLADKATFGSYKSSASRLLGKTTGYNMIRKMQSRVVQSSFTLDVIKHFKDGSGKMGGRRMADLGLTNSLGEDAALSKAIKEHVKYDADGNIESINFQKWDVDAREKFQYAMIRDEAQQIQRTLVGELPPWMNKPMMALLFQFREMPLVAQNKQLGRSLAFADREAVVGVVANASMAGLVRWAKFAALGTAAAAITGEEVSDPTSGQMQVSKYITQFGIYADAYDLVLGQNKLADVESSKDLGELALNEVPVLGLMKDYYDAFGGADDSKELIDAAQGLTPLGNTAMGEMLYTLMQEQFGATP